MQIARILQIIIVVMLLIRASTQGLAIFAADPEAAKVEANSGGFGLITRISGPAIIMLSAIAMLMVTSGAITAKRCTMMLFPVILSMLSSGSKGAFITLLIAYVIALSYQKMTTSNFVVPRVGRSVILFIILLFAYVFLVLLIRGSDQESPLVFVASTLGVRFLAYGDALYYFFFNDLHLLIYSHPLDYILDYFTSPVLAMARLIEYPTTLGLRISGEMFSMERGGPNPTMFVEGYVYFGYLFGCAYTFIIGVLFQYLRFDAFNAFKRFSAWSYLRFSVIFNIASVLPVDMILVVGDVVNAILVVFLVWFLHQVVTILFNLNKLKIA